MEIEVNKGEVKYINNIFKWNIKFAPWPSSYYRMNALLKEYSRINTS